MRLCETPEFLEWAKKRGVVPTSTASATYRHIKLQSETVVSRYWIVPYDTDELREDEVKLFYIASAIHALDDWQECGIMKTVPGWLSYEEPYLPRIFGLLGIPADFDGPVLVDQSEKPTLFSLAQTLCAFGWNVNFDAYLVPDHGKQMLFIDHDIGVVGYFADEESCQTYTERLAKDGITLPTKPPTRFLRWEDWMGPEPEDWGKHDNGQHG
jgi:hypothetical protein